MRCASLAQRAVVHAVFTGLTATLALLCMARPAAAGAPSLPVTATTLAGFVPAGWQIEQEHAVDLNRDGRPDAVLLLQPVAPPAGKSPERVLAVALRQGSSWMLAAQNARLIPQLDSPSQEDPLVNGEITVKSGGFRLGLGLMVAMGSYGMTNMTYRFRLERGCVRLIGYDRLDTHRGTLATQDLSINFLTGVVLQSSGNAQSDTAQQRKSTLAVNPRRCLGDLDSAARFKPLG